MLKIKHTQLAALTTMWFIFSSGIASASVNCVAGGQCTQTITMAPGWNAIYLQVTPDDNNPITTNDISTNTVFADFLDLTGPQISSVWTWLPHRAKIEFVQNQSTEDLLSQPGWLRFFPAVSPDAFLTNLHAVSANRAYLVKLEGAVGANLVVTGKPVMPRTQWVPDALNFIGFHVDPAAPPTFSDFLAASSAHVNPSVYQLNSASGVWELKDPTTTIIDPHKAYWIYSDGGSSYTGPLQLERGKRLDYGASLESLTLSLRNLSSTPHNLSLDMVANGIPIEHENTAPRPVPRWLPMPLNSVVAADELKRITVGVRRSVFTPGEYAEVLSVTVPGLSRWLVPVTASAPVLRGLFIGTVEINYVSHIHNYRRDCNPAGGNPGIGYSLCTNPTGLASCDIDGTNPGAGTTACIDTGLPWLQDPNLLAEVATPMQFRFLLHRDALGQARLLKDVIIMWKDGTDPVTDPGHYVLVTDDTLVPNFKGITLRDGEVVGKRLSSIAYDFVGDTHDLDWVVESVQLSTVLSMPGDAPTNPFRHKYHPQHDGFDVDYVTPNNESYAVSRDILITFGSGDETQSNAANYSLFGGSYREVITGLHKFPIEIRGTLTLQHISPVDVLNQ